MSEAETKDEIIARLVKERDEAQAKAYRLGEDVERLEKEARSRRRWLDNAKEARGYHYNVSFDTVWAETCAKADRAEAAESSLASMTAERDRLLTVMAIVRARVYDDPRYADLRQFIDAARALSQTTKEGTE